MFKFTIGSTLFVVSAKLTRANPRVCLSYKLVATALGKSFEVDTATLAHWARTYPEHLTDAHRRVLALITRRNFGYQVDTLHLVDVVARGLSNPGDFFLNFNARNILDAISEGQWRHSKEQPAYEYL